MDRHLVLVIVQNNAPEEHIKKFTDWLKEDGWNEVTSNVYEMFQYMSDNQLKAYSSDIHDQSPFGVDLELYDSRWNCTLANPNYDGESKEDYYSELFAD